MRFIRFRAVALRQCRLEMARPSRASFLSFDRCSTVNSLSRLRVGRLNTRLNDRASSSRLALPKPSLELLVNPGLMLAAAIEAAKFTASAVRGPWRDGASARGGRLSSPCARGTRGSWHALFCWAEMCVSLLVTWVISRPGKGRTFRRPARVRTSPDSVNRLM